MIRLGDLKVKEQDFLQAFEPAKTFRPISSNLVLPVSRRLAAGWLARWPASCSCSSAPRELGIEVSQAELGAAAHAVKTVRPPGDFEQALIDRPMLFDVWKQRLRCRLLMGQPAGI